MASCGSSFHIHSTESLSVTNSDMAQKICAKYCFEFHFLIFAGGKEGAFYYVTPTVYDEVAHLGQEGGLTY